MKPGTTVRDIAKMVGSEVDKFYQYAEGVGGRRVSTWVEALRRVCAWY